MMASPLAARLRLIDWCNNYSTSIEQPYQNEGMEQEVRNSRVGTIVSLSTAVPSREY